MRTGLRPSQSTACVAAMGLRYVIVSDVGRPADFTSRAINSLKTLKGCASWTEDTPDLDALYRSAQESTSWFHSGLFILCQSHAQSMLDEGRLNYVKFLKTCS
jgi:hypothetical protein